MTKSIIKSFVIVLIVLGVFMNTKFYAYATTTAVTLPNTIINGVYGTIASGNVKFTYDDQSKILTFNLIDKTKIGTLPNFDCDTYWRYIKTTNGLDLQANALTVMIGDGIQGIGKYVFWGFKSLNTVIISDSVAVIDDYAFYGTGKITSLTIGKSVTKIGKYAFANNGKLCSLTDLSVESQVISSDAFNNMGVNVASDITITCYETNTDLLNTLKSKLIPKSGYKVIYKYIKKETDALTTAGSSVNLNITAQIEAHMFDVTVSTNATVCKYIDGSVLTPTNLYVKNNMLSGCVHIIGAKITNLNDWNLVDYKTDMTQKSIYDKVYSVALNGCTADKALGQIVPSGGLATNINPGEQLDLVLGVNINCQSNATNQDFTSIELIIDYVR